MFLARKIKYQPNWTIVPKYKDMNLVQCGEKKPINKLRFPSLLNEKVFKNNFIQNLTYSEFEIPFKFKIDDDFLNPEKSILDSWIFESIPYQNGPFPDNQKHHIPCYSVGCPNFHGSLA